MQNFIKYITEEYYSNCLIEAIKAKIHNPSVKLYFCKPTKCQMFHLMWEDESGSYDFSDSKHHELKWFQCLLFKGRIRKFDKNFAKRYSSIRNKRM